MRSDAHHVVWPCFENMMRFCASMPNKCMGSFSDTVSARSVKLVPQQPALSCTLLICLSKSNPLFIQGHRSIMESKSESCFFLQDFVNCQCNETVCTEHWVIESSFRRFLKMSPYWHHFVICVSFVCLVLLQSLMFDGVLSSSRSCSCVPWTRFSSWHWRYAKMLSPATFAQTWSSSTPDDVVT